ncbi:MAG: nitrilase-related carbon-nitrogen hydrolase [Thermomicrobiales bacterium]
MMSMPTVPTLPAPESATAQVPSEAIRVGLAQVRPCLGDLDANIATHERVITEARDGGADMLVFPELALTGYFLRDLVSDVAMRADDDRLRALSTLAGPMDLVLSFAEEDARGRFFIAAAYWSGGELIHLHRKVYLPTYGFFDDGRFFGRGDRVRAFDTRFGRVGMLICEDFWHLSSPYLLWQDGADMLFFCNNHPGRGTDSRTGDIASIEFVSALCRSYAGSMTVPIVQCNRVGWEDGINFWGESFVVDAGGVEIARAPAMTDHLLIADLDRAETRRRRVSFPSLRDERPDLVRRELARILREQ